ncbi:MAG TPA: Ig-like domain-containing protein [Novosphingobium sp.]|nr:Ig-like domain-containing protein [Novosphingobium sp.]
MPGVNAAGPWRSLVGVRDMAVQAKVSSTSAGINSAPVQVVDGTVAVPAGSNVALNVAPEAVAGYGRDGADLLVHLKSGEVVRIANFYVDPTKVSHLLLVNEDGLVTAEVGQATTGALSSATYVPIDATAGFSAPAAGAGASAGATAATAAGAGGAGLSAGTLIPLAALAGGGIAAASSGGGDHKETAPPTPPDTTAPTAATGLAINAAGDRLTGNAEAGATVRIDVDGNGTNDYTATVGSNGTFTVTLVPPLVDGETVSVTVRDAAGNTSPAASVTAPDTTEPAPAENVTIAADGTGISGTGEPGSTVNVDIDGDGEIDYTTEIEDDGTFSILFFTPIDNGQEIEVTITDPAGNTSDPVVVTAPDLSPAPTTAPVLDPTNGGVLSGTAATGVAVVLTDAEGDAIGQATIGSDGTWSFTPTTPLPDGTVVSAVAVNALGEAGPAATITVDAVAPAAPVLAPSNGESISGTAEAGATILLTDASGNPIGQAVVDADGNWNVSPSTPLADGTVVNAVAVDAAGNASVAASVAVDAVAPAAPTITPPNATLISGTAEPGSTVILTDADGDTIAQVTADVTGAWSFSPTTPLADGTVVTAFAVDAAGNASPPTTATVDALPPAAATINPTNGGTVTGTAEPGAIVTLTDGSGNPIAEVTVDGTGGWSVTPPLPLPDGTVIHATVTDGAGNSSAPATATVDAVAPAAPVIDPSNGATLTGTAEAGATIVLTDGSGNPLGLVTADGSGSWAFTPASPLPDGTVVNAVAADAAGNVSQPGSATVDAVAPATPTIAPSNGATLSGNAEPGSTVILTDGSGNPIGQVTANVFGTWSFTPATPLANGTVVNAVAQDAAGNGSLQATVIVDAVPPPTPVIDPSNGFLVSGSAEPGAIVVLTDGSGNPIAQVTADVGGNWSFAPSTPLPNGTVVQAVAVDASGNTSGQATATVDAVAPAAPVIDPSNGTNLAGTAEAGATVTLTDGSGNPIGQTTASGSGTWSFTPGTPLPHGTIVNAVASDAAGNASQQSSTTVDAVAPPPPVIEPSNGSQIAGTAEGGARVILSDGNGNPIGETTADSAGNWSFTPAASLANGSTIDGVAQDAAGNTSSPSSTTVDSTPPVGPTINPTNGSEITGTAEPNSTVYLMDGNGSAFARATIPQLGIPIGETVADAQGNWSFTPLIPLPDGTEVIAISVDAAGNVSGPVDTYVDGVPPSNPTIEISSGVMFSGTADAGVTIVLTDFLGNPIGQTTADGFGNWSFTPQVPLLNGWLVNAVAVDAAGNASVPVFTVIDAIFPAAPVINASNGATLSGTAEPNSTVFLTNGLGLPIGQAVTDFSGHWSFTPLLPLPNGTAVLATAQDAAGNASSPAITVTDSVAPPSPTVFLSSDGSVLSGFSEPNSQISLVINGDVAHPIVVNTDLVGGFLVPFVPPLILGESISVTAVDAVGNRSVPSLVTAPDIAPPTISVPEAGDGWINASEAANGIQVDVTIRPTMQVGQVVTVQFEGQNGYEVQAVHVISPTDILLGQVTLNVVPTGGLGPLPDGASLIFATVGVGAPSLPVPFTVDTTAPVTPILSLTNSLLTVSADPGTALNVDVDIGGVTANATLTADNSGLASLNLLTDLDIDLTWDQLLAAQVAVIGEDPAGNASTIASLPILSNIEQPVTIGNFAVDVSLNPLNPRFGISGTTESGAAVAIHVITPVLNVALLPIAADGAGHFSLNLLSPTILSQLGLNITDILNLGSQISLELVAVDGQGHESAAYGLDLTPAGLSLNIGEIVVSGTAGDDVMSGASNSAEHINGGNGNDLILSVERGDHVAAGDGNDTVQITAHDFVTIDGGAGFDTLLLANEIDIDYNGPGVGTLTNIERVDLGTGDSGSTLTLTAAEVNAITDAGNTLQITGENNDTLNVVGALHTGATQQIDGVTYDIYAFGSNTLLIEENTVQVVV